MNASFVLLYVQYEVSNQMSNDERLIHVVVCMK